MSVVVHYIKDVRAGFGDYFTDTHQLAEANQWIDKEPKQNFVVHS